MHHDYRDVFGVMANPEAFVEESLERDLSLSETIRELWEECWGQTTDDRPSDDDIERWRQQILRDYRSGTR